MTRDLYTRLIIAALRWVLPIGSRDEAIGDLLEHYDRRTQGRRRWLLGQALNLAIGLGGGGGDAGDADAAAVGDFRGDLKYALRSLRRAGASTTVAVMSLSLGVGLATAVYSVIDGVLLRPLPYHDADRIVRLRQLPTDPQTRVGDDVTRGMVGRWIAESEVLDVITAFGVEDSTVSLGAIHAAAPTARVSTGFFDVLKTRPLHGRLFTSADDRGDAESVAVIGHAFWQGVLASDPQVVGRRIQVDTRPYTVVGVLPAAFAYPSSDVAVFALGRYHWPDPTMRQAFASVGPPLRVLARMKPGVSPSDVEAEGVRVWNRLAAAAGYTSTATPPFLVRDIQDELTDRLKPALLVLMTAVACVLVITCVNLTNLLLARGTVRQREMALRAALGASRWGMSRALAYESLIIGLTGGLAGLLVAWGIVRWLPEFSAVDPGLATQIQLDGRVLAFATAVTAVISVIFGALPAWQAPATRVKEALSASHVHLLPGASLRAEHLRNALVVLQVALAIILVASAALLSRSLVGLLRVDLGFQPEQALSFQIRLPAGADRDYGWRVQYVHDLLQALSRRPGVAAAGFTTSLPMQDAYATAVVRVDGVAPPAGDARPQAHREIVSSGYFQAIGMRVLAGRGFADSDTAESEKVIVVNEHFARAFLPGRDPIGHRVMSYGRDWYRIVGLVASKRHGGSESEPRPEFYNVLTQAPVDSVSGSAAGFVVRSRGSADQLWPTIRTETRQLMPDAPIHHETNLSERVWRQSAQPRFYASVAGVFAVLALVTSLVGLYGVLSFAVERRRVEIGVRRALGATPRQISNLVLGRGLALVGIGVPIGVAGAALGAGALRTMLFGIEPLDPATFITVVIAVPAVALIACYLPARRATFIEPLDALRE